MQFYSNSNSNSKSSHSNGHSLGMSPNFHTPPALPDPLPTPTSCGLKRPLTCFEAQASPTAGVPEGEIYCHAQSPEDIEIQNRGVCLKFERKPLPRLGALCVVPILSFVYGRNVNFVTRLCSYVTNYKSVPDPLEVLWLSSVVYCIFFSYVSIIYCPKVTVEERSKVAEGRGARRSCRR